MITEIPKSKTRHGLQFSKFETKIKIYLKQSNEIQLISHKKKLTVCQIHIFYTANSLTANLTLNSLPNTHILYCKFIACKFLDESYDNLNTKE
jgi:hypothetical protein